MKSRPLSFVRQNPVTPALVLMMAGILAVEFYVVEVSKSLFQYLFVAQWNLTIGFLLAPISHGSIFHYISNMATPLIHGWALERKVERREFLAFTFLAAYVPIYLQVVYSHMSAGQAGTLGFSGATFAFPPAYGFLAIRDNDYGLEFHKFLPLFMALALSLLMPFYIAGYLDFLSLGVSKAKIAHSAGFSIGVAYGAWKYSSTRD